MILLPWRSFQSQQHIYYSKKSPHMGLPSYCFGLKILGKFIWTTQVGSGSRTWKYLVHSPFNVGSVALVQNPKTGHVSPQFHVGFDDELPTVTIMREVINPPNWTDPVQHISQNGALKYIDLKDIWFNPYFEEDNRKTPSNEMSVATENNNNMLTLSQSVPNVQEISYSRVASASELI